MLANESVAQAAIGRIRNAPRREQELLRGFGIVPAVAGALALASLGAGLVACSDDDGGSEEDEAAIQATIDAVNQAQLDGNVENIDQYLTEDGAKTIFFSSLEDIKADPSIISV